MEEFSFGRPLERLRRWRRNLPSYLARARTALVVFCVFGGAAIGLFIGLLSGNLLAIVILALLGAVLGAALLAVLQVMTDKLRDFAGAIGIVIALFLLMAMIGSFTD